MKKVNIKHSLEMVVLFALLFLVSIITAPSSSLYAITVQGLDYVPAPNNAYDIRGQINGSTSHNLQTTYDNAGYSLNIEIDGMNRIIKNVTTGTAITINNVTATLTEVQSASGVDVKLTITSSDGLDHSYRIAITSDLQLGSNDYATIYKNGHSGLVMTQDDPTKTSDYGAKFYINFHPEVTTTWIGQYNNRQANKYHESPDSAYTAADHVDVGAAWSWQGSLTPGAEATFQTNYRLAEAEHSTVKFHNLDHQLSSEQSALVGGAIALPAFEDNHTHSWCDSPTGTGTCYSGGQSIILSQTSVDLYEVLDLRSPSTSSDLVGDATEPNTNPSTHDQTNNFTLNFHLGDGNINPITAAYGTTIPAPAPPTKPGHTFIGWYINNIRVDLNDTITVPATDVDIIAHWQVNEYTITYNLNDGSEPRTVTMDYGAEILLPLPMRSGYSFRGWYLDAACTLPYSAVTMEAENLTLYAKWQANKYTVSYDLNGGTGYLAPETITYGDALAAPTPPTREGYTFIGWQQGNAYYEFTTMPAHNLELIAAWQVNQYTITFDADNGATPTILVGDYDTDFTAPVPEKIGHTFLGWYVDGNPSNPFPFETFIARDLTLVAKWRINQYTLSFNSNGGSPVPDITSDYNSTVSAPTIPTREGHTFLGWYLDGIRITISEELTIPATNLTLTARWTTNEPVAPIEPDAPTTPTSPETPTDSPRDTTYSQSYSHSNNYQNDANVSTTSEDAPSNPSPTTRNDIVPLDNGPISTITPSKVSPLGAVNNSQKFGALDTIKNIIMATSPYLCLILLALIFFLLFKHHQDENQRKEKTSKNRRKKS